MIVEHIVGNLSKTSAGTRAVELFQIEWFEAGKRILHRKTDKGTAIALRFMTESHRLQQNDILHMDSDKLIVVDILPSDAIEITPHSMLEMAGVCYEIGNKHLPLFIQDNTLLIPYEEPIYRWLTATGYTISKVHKKLLNIINATVQPHSHSHGSDHEHHHDHEHDHHHDHDHHHESEGSVFSKIMEM